MNDTSRALRYTLGELCERYNRIVADKDVLDFRLGSAEPYEASAVDVERIYELESHRVSREVRELIAEIADTGLRIREIEGFESSNARRITFAKRVLLGALAGAAGTAVLNAATYADMALRGRPPSQVPEKMVGEIARKAGIASLAEPPDDAQRHRREGIAALLGYADGFITGALLGAVRTTRTISPFWTGITLGLATMLWSEVPATAMGQTDPRSWGAAGWMSDIIPRCLYGWVTCAAYDALIAKN